MNTQAAPPRHDEAHDPRYCGHLKDSAPYLGGQVCQLKHQNAKHPDQNIACDPATCPIKTRATYERRDGTTDVHQMTLDVFQAFDKDPQCRFCNGKRSLGRHRDWCVMPALIAFYQDQVALQPADDGREDPFTPIDEGPEEDTA
jgi:hypothetical protein